MEKIQNIWPVITAYRFLLHFSNNYHTNEHIKSNNLKAALGTLICVPIVRLG